MNKNIDKNKGIVLRIEKSSIHDGPGLRTVVFFKGCPLRCRWCSTPESQEFHIEKGACADACPQDTSGTLNKTYVNYGKEMTVNEVVKEIMKDSIFFFHSGGGATLSGGEVLSQADFAANILRECHNMGINTAIETSLHSNYDNIEKLLPWLDYLFVDIKHMDSREHKKWVGVDNAIILENIKKVDSSDYNLKIHVRVPIIPSINDDKNNLTEIVCFCKDIKKLEEIELLPYHRLGMDTYRKLGREYELKRISTPSKEYVRGLAVFMSEIIPDINIKFDGKYIGD